MIRKFFKWVFREELENLHVQIEMSKTLAKGIRDQRRAIDNVLNSIDVSVDVNEYSYNKSWAVVSLQGKRADFVKFIDLRDSEIREIEKFLRRFERHHLKIDASPSTSGWLKRKNE